MQAFTQKLWDKQNRHPGDRTRLFRAVEKVLAPQTVLYAGSYVDLAASFVFPNVTYVDMDRRAKRFFDDEDGVIVTREALLASNRGVAYTQAAFAYLFERVR